jgi:hypothetical protein
MIRRGTWGSGDDPDGSALERISLGGTALERMAALPSNIDCNLFRHRNGGWCVRIEGDGIPRTIVGQDDEGGCVTPALALLEAGVWLMENAQNLARWHMENAPGG